METRKAIMAFSQSEKIKAALISLSQVLEMVQHLSPEERRGAERVFRMNLSATVQEVRLARTLAGQGEWDEIESLLDRALIMMDSGVGQEGLIHLARAISRVTTVGQRSMGFLKEGGFI
jgi:hypothetical protein